MNTDDLTIGQVKGLTAMFSGNGIQAAKVDHGMAIVVMDRGFVYVGCAVTNGDWCEMTNAKNIRYWGTDKGLAQLIGGPTSKTKLDGPIPVLRAPMRAIIHIIPVEASAWK